MGWLVTGEWLEATGLLLQRAASGVAAGRELVEALDGVMRIDPVFDGIVEDYGDAVRVILDAFEVLADGVALADTFPDGTRRPDVPTPRQIVYLANLARIPSLERRADGAALGLFLPSRRCDHPGCGQFAMRWTERSICYTHGSDDERETNSRANEIYKQALADVSPEE